MKIQHIQWTLFGLLGCAPVEVKTDGNFSSGEFEDETGGEDVGSGGGSTDGGSTDGGSTGGGSTGGDSTGGGDDGIDPGTCDGSPGEILCIDEVAIECDDAGDIVGTQECEAPLTCTENIGCFTCLIDAGFGSETPPSLVVRPEMTTENFGWEHLQAASVDFNLFEGAAAVGTINFEHSGDSSTWWNEAGEAMPSTFTVEASELPLRLFVHAHAAGSTGIEVRHEGCDDEGIAFSLESHIQPPFAGHTIEESPWFERTQVFNVDEEVWATLSPFRKSHLIDKTMDFYVVDHRQPTEWAADQTLSDVRDDGPTSVTISGDALPENRWLIWNDGPDIGPSKTQDYDLVFDVNSDGILNPGDISYGPGDAHGGLTMMGDLSQEGASSVEAFTHASGYWLGQKVYYPADIGSREPSPLVVISHGNGHDFLMYDYLGEHLASHGYVVMTHRNETGPGIETSSTTTLENTDHFLSVMGGLDGGALDGHVDGSRIVWIGHSRGGEGVVRAYDRMVDEGYSTDNYDENDIVVISSIAPTIFFTVAKSDPHDKPYHIFAGAADGDVTGGPNYDQVQYFRMTSAAEGIAQVTYLHGVSHNDFNSSGYEDGTGPDLIGPSKAQRIAKAYYLALVRAYADQHTPSLDYFKRRADVFRPYDLDPGVTIANEYRPDPEGAAHVIDDFQSGWDEETASSDAEVTHTVSSFYEGKMDDANTNLSWGGGDPMNGMTQACCDGDLNRGAVFQWESASELTWHLSDASTDVSAFTYISVRAAQGTRHPLTTDLDSPLDFSITFTDVGGVESTIWIGDVGQITSPYRRSGLGGGSGWSNEFNTIRLRLAAFTDGTPSLDLRNIVSIRLDFGGDYGTESGRLAIDDLMLEY